MGSSSRAMASSSAFQCRVLRAPTSAPAASRASTAGTPPRITATCRAWQREGGPRGWQSILRPALAAKILPLSL